jgi:hypothetical protein
MKSTIFAVVAFAATVTAVPAVTPIPLTPANKYPTCTWWPNWIRTPDADVTGSVMFVVSEADDSAINDLTLQQFTIPYGFESTRNIMAVHLAKSNRVQRTYTRCINGNGMIGSPAQNITISKDLNNAHLVVNPSKPGYIIEPYAHEINGVRQDGVFIGALNQTKWGFSYKSEAGCNGARQMYYEAKLLGLPVDPDTEPGAAYPPEFEGFIKVITW